MYKVSEKLLRDSLENQECLKHYIEERLVHLPKDSRAAKNQRLALSNVKKCIKELKWVLSDE